MLDPAAPRRAERFREFNARGGKFRVAVTNACNLDCFFCHNEAMPNPRRPDEAAAARAARDRLGPADLAAIVDAYCALGGAQVNITGGEPLAWGGLTELLERVERRATKLVLNSNVLLAERLLRRPRIEALSGILASLHTTDDAQFEARLGRGSAREVMDNIVALSRHGYAVEVNYSLGPYNRDEFPRVLEFCATHGLSLKAIALVRPHEAPDFYGGEWVDPRWLEALLEARGAVSRGVRDALGGRTTEYRLGDAQVKVKNIARGRLVTSYCAGCPHHATCGEGIYGLRVGVDGVWKPCLLRQEAFVAVDARPYAEQILELIDRMLGDEPARRFVEGAPS
ncbi:MAG: radical SAM protein [Caldilineaceae bacterium]|nr:radical SAM protein [Caldilineaceae bacterium]